MYVYTYVYTYIITHAHRDIHIYILYELLSKSLKTTSIAETLLSEMCTKHCEAIVPPPKAIMAQNTGKRYGHPTSDNRK